MKNHIKRRSAHVALPILAAAVSGTLLAGCLGGGANGGSDTPQGSGQVITYNTPEKWANWGAVLDSFEETTGIKAPSDPKNSGQALAAIQAESKAPSADAVYLGIVFGLEADKEGLLAEYTSARVDEIPDGLKSTSNTWFTVHQGAIAFLVNTKAIGDTPVPQCWEDLTKPEYKDLVGFLDPTTAAVGYSVLSAANLALGGTTSDWDPGIEWASAMVENNVALPAQTATSAVQQGEVPILIDADFNGYQLAIDEEAPIEVVLPCEGTISIPYVVGKVKGAPHDAAAEEFLDFVLSDQAQLLFAESYLRPIRDIEIPSEVSEKMVSADLYEELVIIPDFAELQGAMSDVLERWENEL